MGTKRLSKHLLACNAKCHRQTMTDCRIKNLFIPTIHTYRYGALPYIYCKQTHNMTIISNECFGCACVWMTNSNEEKIFPYQHILWLRWRKMWCIFVFEVHPKYGWIQLKSSPQSQHAANFWTINLPNFISNKRTFLLKLLMLWKLYGITSSSSQPLHFAYWFCIETVVEKLFNSWTIHSLEKHFSVVLILFFSKPILKGMSVLEGKSRKVCETILLI